MPILITVVIVNRNDGLLFGLLISYLIGWGTAIYFIRMILWNLYGKEVISIKDNCLIYYCYYKFFIENKVNIDLENIEIYPTHDNESTESNMTIINGDTQLETHFLIDKLDIEQIKQKILKMQQHPIVE